MSKPAKQPPVETSECQGCGIEFVVTEDDTVHDDGAIFCRHCWMDSDLYADDLKEERKEVSGKRKKSLKTLSLKSSVGELLKKRHVFIPANTGNKTYCRCGLNINDPHHLQSRLKLWCSACGKKVATCVPKGGDGTEREAMSHKDVGVLCIGTGMPAEWQEPT